jgi:phage-related protein
MPLCRALGAGLWELRSNLASDRTARVLFFVHGNRIGVVHGFIKKTQKTPDAILQWHASECRRCNNEEEQEESSLGFLAG